MRWIKIPIRLVNKSNNNIIKFNPRFWRAISGIVDKFKKMGNRRLYWIGPSDTVKTVEEIIALHFKTQEDRSWGPDAHLGIDIRLVRQKVDVDGVKAILDGIEKSGRIANDRQFDEIHIKRVSGRVASIEFCVYEVEKEVPGDA